MAERFDAFISYSRSASSALAGDLQSGIERFAKPWYRLRSSRVFRDDASMSANAALWSTIETGLTQSEWLILIASPEAARSEYVDNEIAWWVEHKDANHILLVQGAGELAWDRAAGSFSTDTDAIPPALRGAYAEEPRWIDMRWFSDDTSAGKGDPRFTERVADLAATIRGLERDRLVGENVRQHRRAITLARAAVGVLAILLVASIVAGVVAVAQRNEAVEQARISTARQLAATALSLLPTDAATAKLLAMYGYQLQPEAQTQAALLAAVTTGGDLTRTADVNETITATATNPGASTVAIGTESGAVWSWESGGDPVQIGSIGGSVFQLSISDDGAVIAGSTGPFVSDIDGAVALWVEGRPVDVADDLTGPVAVSPDGGTVVSAALLPAAVEAESFYGDSSLAILHAENGYEDDGDRSVTTPAVADLTVRDDEKMVAWVDTTYEGGRVMTVDLGSSEVVADVDGSAGVPRDFPGLLSPDGQYLVQVLRGGYASWPSVEPNDIPIYRADQDSDVSAPVLLGWAPDDFLGALAVSADGSRFAAASGGLVYVAPTRELGDPVVAPLVLEGAQAVSTLHFASNGLLVSSDGSRVSIRALDAGNPLQTELPYQAASTSGAAHNQPLELRVNDDGTTFGTVELAFANDGVFPFGTTTWRTVDDDGFVAGDGIFLAWKDSSSAFVLQSGEIVLQDVATGASSSIGGPAVDELWGDGGLTDAPRASSVVYRSSDDSLLIGGLALTRINATTGEVLQTWDDVINASISADGRFAVSSVDTTGESDYVSRVTDLTTGTVVDLGASARDAFFSGPLLAQPVSETAARLWSSDGSNELGTVRNSYLGPVSVSPDGALAASYTSDGIVTVQSVLTGIVVGVFDVHGSSGDNAGLAFSGDGRSLIAAVTSGTTGSYSVFDLDGNHWMHLICDASGGDLPDSVWRRYTGADKPDGVGCDLLP